MTESKSAVAARIALGLIFTVFGLNGFLGFLPMPPPEGQAGAFMGALAQTGYMFPLIKGTELIAGALLLLGRVPALALLLLAPIVVNIVLFHAILAPAGLLLGLLTLALGAYLAWQYWPRFSAIFKSPERQPSARTKEAAAHG
jgi:hypothetical protein